MHIEAGPPAGWQPTPALPGPAHLAWLAHAELERLRTSAAGPPTMTLLERAHAELALLLEHTGLAADTELAGDGALAGDAAPLCDEETAHLQQLFRDGMSRPAAQEAEAGANTGWQGGAQSSSNAPGEWSRVWQPSLGACAPLLMRLAKEQPRLLAALANAAAAISALAAEDREAGPGADHASNRAPEGLLSAIEAAHLAIMSQLLEEGRTQQAAQRLRWLLPGPDGASLGDSLAAERASVLARLLKGTPAEQRLLLHQAAAAAATSSGSLVTLRLLEKAHDTPSSLPAAAARGGDQMAEHAEGMHARMRLSPKDAAAAALQAVREGDLADAATLLRDQPELGPLVTAAGWDAIACGPQGAFLDGAANLLRALQPLRGASEGHNPFQRLLGILTAELAFHVQVAALVAQPAAQACTAASSSQPRMPAEGKSAGADRRNGEAVSAEQRAGQREAANLAGGEALSRLKAGESAARVLCALAPALGLAATLACLECQPADSVLIRPAGTAEADQQLLRLAQAVTVSAECCAALAQGLTGQQNRASAELRESLMALRGLLERLQAASLLVALLRCNPHDWGVAPAEDADSAEAAGVRTLCSTAVPSKA